MRQIPIDTTKITLIGTGKAAARQQYAELADGSRKATGEQAKEENGFVWVVDVLVDDPESQRAEVIGVKVISWDEPVTPKFQQVKFRGLVAVPFVDQRSGRVALSFRAEGIEASAGAAPKAA